MQDRRRALPPGLARWRVLGPLLLAAAVLASCAAAPPADPELQSIAPGALPLADITLSIPGLGPCTDNPDRRLSLNSREPVNVLVHGCFGSSGRFRGLAQVLAFHGQQTACFTYNDRDSLMRSSGQLVAALDQLGRAMESRQLTVIGHSQGALIARSALVSDRPDPMRELGLQLRLVTVSGPFAGIAAAEQCGNPVTRALTLGLIGPMCRLITGDKWSEITAHSAFIQQPGRLAAQVRGYLKVMTDERGTCRRYEGERCTESDEIFSLDEQRHPVIDDDPLAEVLEVGAGHVEIVGDERVAPVKLIALLQRHGVLNPTAPQRQAALSQLLARVYGAQP
ncbi:esterase/lipase family protein [Ideonella sp. BN130291]|uniref:esterase/lipase family protein n=1 Tax=Ideonella sp. BN130291 TaxID=3112940 RepID=UPI002E2666A8|nr:hypothetical protein [Ideonella sp. BN130291]